ncbi:MAG: hypothetical protein KUG75_01985 [Pseudomonadales bacterium]|nr:hypothetical protein [Pseudomonadales bacterium]
MSLTARALESAGIPTVIVGSALDIVEYCAVPRFLFIDFPLGNPCGKPFDEIMQTDIIKDAFKLLSEAKQAQCTVKGNYSWGSDIWRENYSRVDKSMQEKLRLRGERRRQRQGNNKNINSPPG